jgi:hypothetical protein
MIIPHTLKGMRKRSLHPKRRSRCRHRCQSLLSGREEIHQLRRLNRFSSRCLSLKRAHRQSTRNPVLRVPPGVVPKVRTKIDIAEGVRPVECVSSDSPVEYENGDENPEIFSREPSTGSPLSLVRSRLTIRRSRKGGRALRDAISSQHNAIVIMAAALTYFCSLYLCLASARGSSGGEFLPKATMPCQLACPVILLTTRMP